MVYCPYTDRDIPETETNSDHVIPLSLGGVTGFEITVDADFNATVGSKLEGSLANEFIWALARTKYDARGHSGKEPQAIIRNATYGDECRVAQVYFHNKQGVRLWDVRDGEFKSGRSSIKINSSLNIDLPIRFTAKVALGAAYYVYGNVFRENVDHQQLREVMLCRDLSKLDLSKTPEGLGIDRRTLTADSYLHERATQDDLQCIRLLCSAVRGSVVMLIPGTDSLRVAVGILGRYLAMVNVPANTKSFPNSGEFSWGHVIALSDKKVYRASVADGISQFVGGDYHTETFLPLIPMNQLPREVVAGLVEFLE